MQSFLRKLVTHHKPSAYTCHRNIFHTHTHTHTHTPFSSLPSPPPSPPQLLLGRRIPSSFFHTHHSRSSPSCRHSIPPGFRGFLSNALVRVSSRRLLDCRPKLPSAHFHRHSNNFGFRGWRSWLRRLSPNDVVLGLIIANVAVFLLWRIADQTFMINNFTISLNNFKSGRLHTLITNAFSHIDTGHIISNMIGLYFFGMNIGRNFGPEFLLKLYLAGAVGGAVFYLVHQAYKAQTSKGWRFGNSSRELALGASGAVNAIMLLDIFLNPRATLYLDFIIPVPAILLGIFLIGKDMLMILEGNSQISGAGHLGGVAVAAIAWARLRKGRF